MINLNVEKQIDYWKNSAISDFETAEILIEKHKYLQGLFFCHLTIEKILKAHYSKTFSSIAPKTHDLIYLLDKIQLPLIDNHRNTLALLMKYQLEGRYPDSFILSPTAETVNDYLIRTKDLFTWLMKQL